MTKSNTQYLSKEKLEELKQELENLKNVKRKKVAEELEFARSLGDLSENAEYQQARANQADIEDRIFEIETILKTAVIVSGDKTGTVFLGSEVVVKKDKQESTKTFYIVGSEESDVTKNKISNASPLGQAMLGKKIGDNFKVKTPNGEITYKILEIK